MNQFDQQLLQALYELECGKNASMIHEPYTHWIHWQGQHLFGISGGGEVKTSSARTLYHPRLSLALGRLSRMGCVYKGSQSKGDHTQQYMWHLTEDGKILVEEMIIND